jgi:hypothetical protein
VRHLRPIVAAIVVLVGTACTRTVEVFVTPSASVSPSVTASASPPPGSIFVQSRGVKMAVPLDWHAIGEGGPTGEATLVLAYSPDDDSFLTLQRFGVLINVTPDRLEDVRPQLVQLLRDTAAEVGGQILEPLQLAETAGFPGFAAKLSLTTPNGNAAEELLYVFFDQTNEYTLACAYTPAMLVDVTAACEVARSTLTAQSPFPAA